MRMSINDIEEFFRQTEIPDKEIRIDSCSVIVNPRKMVESHIKYLRGNPKRKKFLPYYNRLITVIKAIQK
jgi:hypothetical protein